MGIGQVARERQGKARNPPLGARPEGEASEAGVPRRGIAPGRKGSTAAHRRGGLAPGRPAGRSGRETSERVARMSPFDRRVKAGVCAPAAGTLLTHVIRADWLYWTSSAESAERHFDLGALC